MKQTDRDLLRLEHILHSISAIQGYVINITLDDFLENEMMQSACLRHLEIIGEASSKITDELKSKFAHIPWVKIVGLRNIVAHEYFRVNKMEVWSTIQNDLPAFKKQVASIIDILKG
jgi:uncharacterized protein with HEPN domain